MTDTPEPTSAPGGTDASRPGQARPGQARPVEARRGPVAFVALAVVSTLVPLAVLLWVLREDGTTRDGAALVAPGESAPDFALPTLDGGTVTLDDYRGRPVVLTFFASWCLPCDEETVLLRDALDERDGAFDVLAVVYRDDPERARAFLEERGADWAAADDQTLEVSLRYGVLSIPVTFFLDGDGTVVDRLFGLTSRGDLAEALDAIIAAP